MRATARLEEALGPERLGIDVASPGASLISPSTVSNARSSGHRFTGRHAKPRINNTLHLILSVLTLGLWALVWITLGAINSTRRPMCTTCGSQVAARQIANEAGFDVQPGHGQRAPFQPRQQFAPPDQPPAQLFPPPR